MYKALGYQRLRRHGRAFGRLTGATPAVVEENDVAPGRVPFSFVWLLLVILLIIFPGLAT